MSNPREGRATSFPVGTKVVTRVPVCDATGRELRPAGNVGIVVRSPEVTDGLYRVRFADGDESPCAAEDLILFGLDQEKALGQGDGEDLFEHVIYRCTVGSRAYGLETDRSDLDLRGIFLPPAELHWGLVGVPQSLERPGADELYWELQHFLVLALKANPTVLECLFTDLVAHASPLAVELRAMRGAFLSRFVHKTMSGYVLSQMKKLARSEVDGGAVRWKHAMHLLRLLMLGTEVLRTGHMQLKVGSERDRLLAIKGGEVPMEEVQDWHRQLQQAFDEALGTSPLPEHPDYRRVNTFLIDARRSMIK